MRSVSEASAATPAVGVDLGPVWPDLPGLGAVLIGSILFVTGGSSC